MLQTSGNNLRSGTRIFLEIEMANWYKGNCRACGFRDPRREISMGPIEEDYYIMCRSIAVPPTPYFPITVAGGLINDSYRLGEGRRDYYV
jgi:hypothetical protein